MRGTSRSWAAPLITAVIAAVLLGWAAGPAEAVRVSSGDDRFNAFRMALEADMNTGHGPTVDVDAPGAVSLAESSASECTDERKTVAGDCGTEFDKVKVMACTATLDKSYKGEHSPPPKSQVFVNCLAEGHDDWAPEKVIATVQCCFTADEQESNQVASVESVEDMRPLLAKLPGPTHGVSQADAEAGVEEVVKTGTNASGRKEVDWDNLPSFSPAQKNEVLNAAVSQMKMLDGLFTVFAKELGEVTALQTEAAAMKNHLVAFDKQGTSTLDLTPAEERDADALVSASSDEDESTTCGDSAVLCIGMEAARVISVAKLAILDKISEEIISAQHPAAAAVPGPPRMELEEEEGSDAELAKALDLAELTAGSRAAPKTLAAREQLVLTEQFCPEAVVTFYKSLTTLQANLKEPTKEAGTGGGDSASRDSGADAERASDSAHSEADSESGAGSARVTPDGLREGLSIEKEPAAADDATPREESAGVEESSDVAAGLHVITPAILPASDAAAAAGDEPTEKEEEVAVDHHAPAGLVVVAPKADGHQREAEPAGDEDKPDAAGAEDNGPELDGKAGLHVITPVIVAPAAPKEKPTGDDVVGESGLDSVDGDLPTPPPPVTSGTEIEANKEGGALSANDIITQVHGGEAEKGGAEVASSEPAGGEDAGAAAAAAAPLKPKTCDKVEALDKPADVQICGGLIRKVCRSLCKGQACKGEMRRSMHVRFEHSCMEVHCQHKGKKFSMNITPARADGMCDDVEDDAEGYLPHCSAGSPHCSNLVEFMGQKDAKTLWYSVVCHAQRGESEAKGLLSQCTAAKHIVLRPKTAADDEKAGSLELDEGASGEEVRSSLKGLADRGGDHETGGPDAMAASLKEQVMSLFGN